MTDKELLEHLRQGLSEGLRLVNLHYSYTMNPETAGEQQESYFKGLQAGLETVLYSLGYGLKFNRFIGGGTYEITELGQTCTDCYWYTPVKKGRAVCINYMGGKDIETTAQAVGCRQYRKRTCQNCANSTIGRDGNYYCANGILVNPNATACERYQKPKD